MIGLPPKMAGFDVIRRRMSVSLQVLGTTHLPIKLPQFQYLRALAVSTSRLAWARTASPFRRRAPARAGGSVRLGIHGLFRLDHLNGDVPDAVELELM